MTLSVALDMSCFRYAGCLLYIWYRRGRDRMVVLMPLVVSLSVTCVMSMVFSGRMVVLMPLVVSLSVTGRHVDGFLRSYGSSNATRCELVSDWASGRWFSPVVW